MNKFVTRMKAIIDCISQSIKSILNRIFNRSSEPSECADSNVSKPEETCKTNHNDDAEFSNNDVKSSTDSSSYDSLENIETCSTDIVNEPVDDAVTETRHVLVVDEDLSDDDAELLSRIEEEHSDVSFRLLNEFRYSACYEQPKPINDEDEFRLIFYKFEDVKDKYAEVKIDKNGEEYIVPANGGIFFKSPIHAIRYKFKGTWNEIERVTKLLKLKFYYVIVNSKGEYVYADTTDNPMM